MEWCYINWKGAYPLETAQNKPEAGSYGIYAIFEKIGKGSKLLYIGETYSQSFGKRLQQHKHDWLHRVNARMTIHFGMIGLPKGTRISIDKVYDIENTFIHVLRPPFNNVGKHGYSGRDIMIINLGKIGTLPQLICDTDLIITLQKIVTFKKKPTA